MSATSVEVPPNIERHKPAVTGQSTGEARSLQPAGWSRQQQMYSPFRSFFGGTGDTGALHDCQPRRCYRLFKSQQVPLNQWAHVGIEPRRHSPFIFSIFGQDL